RSRIGAGGRGHRQSVREPEADHRRHCRRRPVHGRPVHSGLGGLPEDRARRPRGPCQHPDQAVDPPALHRGLLGTLHTGTPASDSNWARVRSALSTTLRSRPALFTARSWKTCATWPIRAESLRKGERVRSVSITAAHSRRWLEAVSPATASTSAPGTIWSVGAVLNYRGSRSRRSVYTLTRRRPCGRRPSTWYSGTGVPSAARNGLRASPLSRFTRFCAAVEPSSAKRAHARPQATANSSRAGASM